MGTICNIQENVNVVLETQSKTYTMHLVEIKGKKRKDKGGGATMQSYLVENLKWLEARVFVTEELQRLKTNEEL